MGLGPRGLEGRTSTYGRQSELAVLDGLVAGARAGQSQVLVLRGEAGIGKTVLLDYVETRAAGCRVARAAGVEAEMELRTPACTSSAVRSWIDWTASPIRNVLRSVRRSA